MLDKKEETDFDESFVLEHSVVAVLVQLVLIYCIDDDIVSESLFPDVQRSIDESLRHFDIPLAAAAASLEVADTNGMWFSLGRWLTTTLSVSAAVKLASGKLWTSGIAAVNWQTSSSDGPQILQGRQVMFVRLQAPIM